MVKYQFGKNWSWCTDLQNVTDITDKDVDYVYRMDTNQCYFGSCKINCVNNPYCLNGLGEKKLINLLQKEPDTPVQRTSYFRDQNQFVGLVNLGATCYINAYLQVWFNNPFFRESILDLRLEKMELEDKYVEDNLVNNSEKLPELKLKSNECLATNLQLLFTLLKETVRKSIDPSFFIKALGLDENIQQDAQEFSQLFLTTLQSILISSPIQTISNEMTKISNTKNKSDNCDLIHNLFQGEYEYVTECNGCKLQSNRTSSFLELTLNIQNSQTITECIDDLLKEEIMDGDNQYYCDSCKSKQNAKRMTKLTSLPPILNLQLLRFVYDRNSGYKKKLTTRIKFSEMLDLNSYTNSQTNESKIKNLYHLGAILMHVGKTAYSGHYTAQIKNFQSSEWFNFNDESITKIKKKNQLGCTDDEVESGKTTDDSKKEQESSKQSKSFSTANAYLLVYYRSDLVDKMSKEDACLTNITSLQSQIIQVDNELLENWFNNLNSSKMGQNELKNTERTLIHSIYENLWLNTIDSASKAASSQKKLTNRQKSFQQNKEIIELSNSNEATENKSNGILKTLDKSKYYFISVDFIRKLITGEFNQSASIDLSSGNFTSKFLCSHKLLNPLAINRLKLVCKTGLELMCDVYTVNLNDLGALEAFNNQNTRCWQCVFNCFNYLKCKDKLKNDAKLFKQLLKYEYNLTNNEILSSNKTEHVDSETNDSTKMHPNLLGEKNEDEIILIDKKDNNLELDETNSVDSKSNSNSNSDINDLIGSDKENRIIKNDPKTTNWYWVGKESLKQWQNLVLKKYETQLPSFKFVDNLPEQITDSKPDIIDETNEVQAEIQEIGNIPPQSSSNTFVDASSNGSIINFFNEDIICIHNNLSPTLNKRLVCSELWEQIFFKYFYNELDDEINQSKNAAKYLIFNQESRECKLCLKENEEYVCKKNQVKNQKEILNDLYYNKQRPNIIDIDICRDYYLIMADFIKEWRSLIKHSKFKDIKIFNQTLLCQHGRLPFNELTMDNSMSTLLTAEEWDYLSKNYKFDIPISLVKKPNRELDSFLNPDANKLEQNENKNNNLEDKKTNFIYDFYPSVCSECMAQNELDKFIFESKKIVIRLIEEDDNQSGSSNTQSQPNSQTNQTSSQTGESNQNSLPQTEEKLLSNELKTKSDFYDDCEIIHLSSKKPRYDVETDNTVEKQEIKNQNQSKNIEDCSAKLMNNNSKSEYQTEFMPARRSKRSRKCKGDIEVTVSSYTSIKSIKLQIASQISRMISEQHLYFNNVELNNDNTLMDYKINKGDILYLRLDQINNNIDEDNCHYEMAHVPEIGFKGTNLLK